MARRSASALIAIAIAACGGDGDADDDGDSPDAPASPLAYAECDLAERVGSFEVLLEELYTAFSGQVHDGVLPTSIFTTLASDGECVLLTAPRYECQPACTGETLCDADLACVPYPEPHDVGTVTVSGLAAELAAEPLPPNFNYTNPAGFPHPGYAPGADIGLSAAGGDYAAFSLRGWGVSAVETPAPTITVESGVPVEVAWTPPPAAGPAKMIVSLNINTHGLVGAHLRCLVDDDGAFTIPAGLVDMLFGMGTSGFPRMTLVRTTSDTARIAPGCVELRVHADATLDVMIPGQTSCTGASPDECPPGQACNLDLLVCE